MAAGRTLAADRAALWRAVAGWLGAGPDFHAAVTELALALLLDGQPHAQATLVERVGKAAAGEGWPDRATAQAPDLEAISRGRDRPSLGNNGDHAWASS